MSNPFVEIVIQRQAQAVSRAGFGVPMIFSAGPTFSGVRVYGSPDDVLVDFASSTEEYKLSVAIFASAIKPSALKIGKRGGGALEDELNALKHTDNAWYYLFLVTILNADILVGAAWTEAEQKLFAFETKSALALAAATPIATTFRARASGIATITTGSNHGLVADSLANIAGLGGVDPYNAVGVVVLSAPTLTTFTYASPGADESSVADTGGTVTHVDATDVVFLKGYDRTFSIYSADANNRAAAAWVGEEAPKDPGSSTWKFKHLIGQIAANPTPSQLAYGTAKHMNFYTNVGGIDITYEGVVASGEFIDIMLGTDWLQANLEADLYQALIDEDKIPYTDAGFDVFRQIILNRLQLAIDQGVLTNDPAPTVFLPKVKDVPLNNRKSRLLNGATFTGFYAGAIHHAGVNGKISV